MFIQVTLLSGYQKPLWYRIPIYWQPVLPGTIVQVPLRNVLVPAIVITQYKNLPENITFLIRDVFAREPFPQDPFYIPFIKKLSNYYQVKEFHFIKRIRCFLQQKTTDKQKEKIAQSVVFYTKKSISLTQEQQKICDFFLPYIVKPQYVSAVLHGVTGSGKTESYKVLIMHAITNNKAVLLLLPEISLAVSFEQRLKKELPSITILGFHSGITKKEKKVLWHQLIMAKPILIIGVHLPVLLPIANLGLIIIDEEHATGYQEKKHPKVNSKEASLLRAKLSGIPILLGSATPSFNTLYNVETKKWHFFQLKKRFSGYLPPIKTVLLSDKKKGKNFWISKALENAIAKRLEKKEQIIIFLNRRGFSFFVQCKACSFIFSCKNCSVSLTLHEKNILRCHYCDFFQQLPALCPTCHGEHKQLIKKGIGTQKVVTILERLFPHARIARADLDTTSKKKKWQKVMSNFSAGALDILVGTQTITKGLHFPRVTLVGILWADLHLHIPMFNATETAIQQLIQVAGRAGRNSEDSLVIVQAMMDYPAFSYLNESDYLAFYKHAMQTRKMLGYPPYKRLVEIELKHRDETIIDAEAVYVGNCLREVCNKKKIGVQILGPAQPPVAKINNIHMRKLYIKGNNIYDLIFLFQHINQSHYKSDIFFTPNPVT